jgi:hypothetical protein
MEAPSPADHGGRLRRGPATGAEGGALQAIFPDSPPCPAGSTGTRGRWLSAAATSAARGGATAPGRQPPRPFGPPWPRSARGVSARSQGCAPGTGSRPAAPMPASRSPAPGPREGPSALAPGSSGARRHRPAGAAPPPRRPRTGPRLRGEPPRCRGREAGTEQCRGRRALPAPSLPSSRSRREPLKQCWGPSRSVAPVPRPQVSTRPRLSTAPGPGQRKTSNKPLAGGGCLLTTGVLIRVRHRVGCQVGSARFATLMDRRAHDNGYQLRPQSGVLELFTHPFLD